MKTKVFCKLCGLPVSHSTGAGKDVFCCNGCKMVHAMLMESDLCEGTTDFKETDLYKKCVAAGVIPDTSQAEPLSALPSDGRDAGVPDSSGPGSASHTTAGSSEPRNNFV